MNFCVLGALFQPRTCAPVRRGAKSPIYSPSGLRMTARSLLFVTPRLCATSGFPAIRNTSPHLAVLPCIPHSGPSGLRMTARSLLTGGPPEQPSSPRNRACTPTDFRPPGTPLFKILGRSEFALREFSSIRTQIHGAMRRPRRAGVCWASRPDRSFVPYLTGEPPEQPSSPRNRACPAERTYSSCKPRRRADRRG